MGSERSGLIARRSLLTAAAAGWAGRAGAADPFEDPETRALATYSESAMVMVVAGDQDAALTLRFCRFPDAGVTWLWCHALVGGRLLAFTHHRLPTTGERLHARRDGAVFAAASPYGASIKRSGTANTVGQVDFDLDLRAHASTAAPHGPGPIRLRASGVFRPGQGLPPSLSDRQELMGAVDCRLEVDGRTFAIADRGKYHEQAQMRPRFIDPFCYLGFWGAGMGGMFLRARNPSGGLADARGARRLVTYDVEPPGVRRRLAASLSDGERLSGELTALSRFSIPIFGERWRGSFVRGRLNDTAVSGMMNDWRPAQVDYRSPMPGRT